jgi:uncharacterized membrane protein YkoI
MRQRHWKPFVLMLLVGVMLCAAASAQRARKKAKRTTAAKAEEAEREVTEAEVPAAALATLKKLAAGAEITEFAEEIEYGHTFYEGSWKNPAGANMDVLVTPRGDLVEIEEQVDADQVPAATLKAARKAAGRGAQLAFEKKTMILYEAKFRKGDRRHELLLTPDGRRVEEEVEKGNPDDDDEGDDDEGEDEDEQEVSIKELPKAVRVTILKQAKGGEIKKIERETEDGEVIYEAEVIMDGKEVELKVGPNGKLLAKEVEEQDGEEDADDEDEEDEDEDDDEDDDEENDDD